jgi:hypothetical protein
VGLDSLLTEINKLNSVRKLGLPEGLFADCSEKLLAAWRARAIKMYPSNFRDMSEEARVTLLAVLCASRQAEITDTLVDLLVALVQKINSRAERRVERQLTAELKKVRGKEGILFRLAEAAVGKPDEIVRRALYPVVGEKTLKDLVAEAKANEKVFKAKVRTTLRASYSTYYRQMPPLLKTLDFTVQQHRLPEGQDRAHPVRAVRLGCPARRDPPPRDLRRGGLRWRNPEDDLRGDFEATRTVHYAAIRQPMDPQEFIKDLKRRMTAGLDRLTAALADGSAGGVKVTTRHGDPWIKVPKLELLEEPTDLQALKEEVIRRWGVLDLLDVLKNADFLTGFTDEFSSVAAYEHGETEAALRHIRRHFITVDNLRAAVTKLVNTTFAARDTAWWGRAPPARRTRRSSAPGRPTS